MDYDNTDSSDNFGKLSKINSAFLVNSQLSNLWLDYFRHIKQGLYLSANVDLDCIWTILGGERDIKGSVVEKRFQIISFKLNGCGTLKDGLTKEGFSNVEDNNLEKFNKQYEVLEEKAIFLRRLQNSQGKGTAYSDGEDEESE